MILSQARVHDLFGKGDAGYSITDRDHGGFLSARYTAEEMVDLKIKSGCQVTSRADNWRPGVGRLDGARALLLAFLSQC